MRIKTDYITNSSSSSFVAWGVGLDDIVIPEELLLVIFSKAYAQCKKNAKGEEPNSYYSEELDEMKQIRTREEKLEWAYDLPFEEKAELLMADEKKPVLEWNDNEYVEAIGISPHTLFTSFPDVPFGKVKAFVAEKINSFFGTELTEDDVRYIKESWQDG